MGLKNPTIEIKVQEMEASFHIFECTGDYSSNNTGGFGGPNQKKQSITKSLLYIMGPDDTDYREPIEVTGDLPNSKGLGYEILPSDIGQTDEIPSGKYKFKLVHTFLQSNSTTVEAMGFHVEVLTKNIQCCIDKLVIDPGKDAFKDIKQKKILELHNLMLGVENQICAGLYDSANTTIDYLKSQCKCNGCK